MVDWKYDILFSFNLDHPGPRPDDLYLYPTSDCTGKLKQFGLIFRKLPQGGLIIQEKRILPDSSLAVIRPMPPEVVFTFVLATSNPAALQLLKPFHDVLPPFSGRRRILYLNNLDGSLQLDTALDHPPQTTPSDTDLAAKVISKDPAVGENDLASLTPNSFSLLADPAETSQLILAAQKPNPPVNQQFPVTATHKNIALELETGAFRLDKTGSINSTEILFADTRMLTTDVVGIIEIFKDPNTDYNTTIRYDIIFEKA